MGRSILDFHIILSMLNQVYYSSLLTLLLYYSFNTI